MKRIIILFMFMIFSLSLIGCNKETIQIPGTSKDFSNDTIKMIELIEKDVKNNTNKYTCLWEEDSDINNYLNKYKEKVLQPNEQEVINIIESGILIRDKNFISASETPPKYNESWDEACIKELQKIYDLK